MFLLEIPGGATIDQNNKKNPKTIEMKKKKKYIYIYIYIYLTNPQNDHNRDQNFGNCSKILKVVQKQLYSVSLEVSNLFNYDLNV